jgi:hypothetical protein
VIARAQRLTTAKVGDARSILFNLKTALADEQNRQESGRLEVLVNLEGSPNG